MYVCVYETTNKILVYVCVYEDLSAFKTLSLCMCICHLYESHNTTRDMDEGSNFRCPRTEKCASMRFWISYQLAVNSTDITCPLHLQLPFILS